MILRFTCKKFKKKTQTVYYDKSITNYIVNPNLKNVRYNKIKVFFHLESQNAEQQNLIYNKKRHYSETIGQVKCIVVKYFEKMDTTNPAKFQRITSHSFLSTRRGSR